jgi:hypothetical protein
MGLSRTLTAASISLGALLPAAALALDAGHADAADLRDDTTVLHTAVVGPDTTYQCSDGCSVPGVLNVDPQGVAGPDVSDPALRIGRWSRTVYISCVYDATGDGIKYLTYVDDRQWAGQWWIDKASLQSPAPGGIDDSTFPRCPDYF